MLPISTNKIYSLISRLEKYFKHTFTRLGMCAGDCAVETGEGKVGVVE